MLVVIKRILIIVLINLIMLNLLGCESEIKSNQSEGQEMPEGYLGDLYTPVPTSKDPLIILESQPLEEQLLYSTQEIRGLKGEKGNPQEISGKPRFIEFWSPTCLTCLASKPVVNGLQEDFGGKVDFISLSTSDYESRDVFIEYGIRVVPTFIIEDSEGNVLFRSSGKAENRVFQPRLEEVLTSNNTN